jgi:hypothetical protein
MSVRLTLVLSGRTVERFEFDDSFSRLKVGRAEDCEVRIDNLGVSRHHCEISRQNGFVVLRDLNSNNGTFVNGNKVDAHNLNTGDVITIGKYTLEYMGNALPRTEAPAADEGELPEGAMTVQVDPASLARMAGVKGSKVKAYFVVAGKGRELPKAIPLEKPVFLVGKDPDADLHLDGWFCPRVVAVVIRDETGFRLLDVTDKGDAVRVNSLRRRDVRLTDQDSVRIRDREMKFMRGTPGSQER